jgi:hypothetical protein
MLKQELPLSVRACRCQGCGLVLNLNAAMKAGWPDPAFIASAAEALTGKPGPARAVAVNQEPGLSLGPALIAGPSPMSQLSLLPEGIPMPPPG